MEWKLVRLGDFISIKSGLAYQGSKLGNGSSILLGMGCVSFEDTFVESGARPYDDDKVDNRFIVKAGDIVLATRQQSDNLPILAMPAIVPDKFNGKKVIFGTNLYKVENTSDLSNRFLFWLLRHQHYVNYIAGVKSGTAVQMVTKKNVERYKFLCPPREIREKIANILWTYEDLIENNKKRIQTLECLAENLYKEWFVRFRFPGHEETGVDGGIPEGWEIEKIGNIGEVIGGGTPSTKIDEYWGGEIPWLTPADLAGFDGVYIAKGRESITELGLRKSSAKLMPQNTVLLSSRAPIGYVALAKNEICTNQGFKSVVCDEKRILHQYLFYFFKMNKNLLEGYGSGATFLELSGGALKKIKILIPPIEIQKAFSRVVDDCFEQIYVLSQENNNLKRQRDLLLPRLMSGELQVK